MNAIDRLAGMGGHQLVSRLLGHPEPTFIGRVPG
jgi:hypothetical protein